MTENQASNQAPAQENKTNDKEFNFRAIEAKLREERVARIEAERKADEALKLAQEANKYRNNYEDNDDYSEPYVDDKRLEKKLSSLERKLEEKFDKRAEERARMLLDREKQESWLRHNPDYYEVMQHAERFAQKDPELAETILQMPEGFERNKLVYKNIKAFGLHKPAPQEQTIQQKIDANRKSPYYQPNGVGSAPYAPTGDFSAVGQKNAYEKMKEMQARLRI